MELILENKLVATFKRISIQVLGFFDKLSTAHKIAKVFGAVAQYRSNREAINMLNSLTDKELKDIGISRGDIRRVVYQEQE
jgi:uncharacterized protein YjiS (DUF1127 family)